ncbi:MAG: hypothetical protein BWX44_00018 [Spirochaetes bacterium ADurb.Bin001]|nr:MAG: hypothetical protein BWX44_00018 [Spirochaetes bacterium ADurb.Bin001]
MPDLLHRVTSPRPVKSLLIFRLDDMGWGPFLQEYPVLDPVGQVQQKNTVTTTINPRVEGLPSMGRPIPPACP